MLDRFSGDRVGDLDEKKTAVKALNTLLVSLDLRIKCPETGAPAILMAHPRGDSMGGGRFRLEVPSQGVRRILSSATLPKIALTPHDQCEKSQGRIR